MHNSSGKSTQIEVQDSSLGPVLEDHDFKQPSSTQPRTSWQRLADLLLSTDPRIRPRTPMGLVAALLYLPLMILINVYAIPHGAVGVWEGRMLTAYCLVGMLAFYPLVRSGFSQRFSEPSLSLPQMIYAEMTAVLTYHYFPEAQVTALQLLCVIQIFGLLRLAPLGAIVAGACAVVFLLCGVALSSPTGLLDPSVRRELMIVGMESLVLTVLALLSYRYSRLRHDVEQQRKELADAVVQVRRLVTHDALTGLYNRQRMQELLERENQRSAHFGKGFCVALIDLDHFKRINDNHGHQVGDEVLRGFAEAAHQVLRETDLIARWGGEEFLALLPDTEPDDMGLVGLERLLRHVAQQQIAPSEPNLRLTFSAGIASHKAGETIDHTIECADKAMYAAKAAGRNRCMVAADHTEQQPHCPAPALPGVSDRP